VIHSPNAVKGNAAQSCDLSGVNRIDICSDLLMRAANYALSKAITASFWNRDRATGEKYALAQRYLDDVLKSTSSPVLLEEARRGVQNVQREAERKLQKE
jgi:hypothetical protein